MSMNFTTIRNTNQETIIHFEAPSNDSAVITIADLTASTQARNADTPKVNIVRFICTGADGAATRVTRSGKNIISVAPENAPVLDLTQYGISDGTNNTADIVIVNDAAKAVTGYITLRKIQGWSTKVETATYGAYDDETAVGASDISGAPGGVPSAN